MVAPGHAHINISMHGHFFLFFFLDGVFVGLVSDILLVDRELVPLSDSKSCNYPPPTPRPP